MIFNIIKFILLIAAAVTLAILVADPFIRYLMYFVVVMSALLMVAELMTGAAGRR